MRDSVYIIIVVGIVCGTALMLGNMLYMYHTRALELDASRQEIAVWHSKIARAYNDGSDLDKYEVENIAKILENNRKEKDKP